MTVKETSEGDQVHSPYLVDRLLERPDENMFNYVKFRLLTQVIQGRKQSLNGRPLRLLDLGCGDKIAQRYLRGLGLEFEYVGVDYESPFEPELLGDLRDPTSIAPKLPWPADYVLLLDVLEHLDGMEGDISKALAASREFLAEDGRLLITIPHMYRLDRMKLPHLHYPEHKVRLRADEWRTLISKSFIIEDVQAVGLLSTLPYMVMLSRRYRPDNALGSTFKYLRESALEVDSLRRLDWHLCRRFGRLSPSLAAANDLLFVARPR